MADPLSIDVFWSFRSPWSYLATPRLLEWQRMYALDIRLRAVQPLAIRDPDFFRRIDPLWPAYFIRDVHRVAEFLGVPFKWPRPDPIVQDWSSGKGVTAAEQPHIHRLIRLGILAQEQGNGLAFAHQVGSLIWGGTENWHEGEHLAEAAARVGFDLAELEAQGERERERLERVVEENHADHHAAGHWGVPTCVFQGEPFFGQDRLDVLLWRLQQHGLQAR